jgi:hypothetical protein
MRRNEQIELARTPGFHFKDNFFDGATAMRGHFEQAIVDSAVNGGVTPFNFAFCSGVYQFLTSSAERVFPSDLTEAFAQAVRSWAAEVESVSGSSTPQVRIYMGGCNRKLAQDNVSQPWHYILGLSIGIRSRASELRVLRRNNDDGSSDHEAILLPFNFNRLIIHRATYPYSIKSGARSMDPADGLVFLDGYLW